MSDSEKTPETPPPPPSSPSEPPSEPPSTPPPAEPSGGAPPPPPTGAPSAGGGSGGSNRGLMLVLSYLGILALIPFFIEKEDREVQWHAKHGLVLFGAEIAVWIVIIVVSGIIDAVATMGCLTCVVQGFLAVGLMVLHIACIVKAVNGERLLIPGISPLADRF